MPARLDFDARSRLAFVAFGQARGPACILLHSLGLTHRVWEAVAERLATAHHVVQVDLPGHGKSPDPSEGFSIQDAAVRVGQLIEMLGLGPVVVIGLSIGGLVAQRLRELRPDDVAGVVLCGTNYLSTPPEIARIMRDYADRVERDGVLGVAEELGDRWLGANPRGDEELRAILRQVDGRVLAGGFRAVAESRIEHEDVVRDTPALVLVAEFDPPTSHAAARELATRYPRGELRVVPRAYHASPSQQPAFVAEAIAEFLNRLADADAAAKEHV